MSSTPSGWATPKKNWSSADIVSSTDLNRVEGNIDALDNGARTLDPAQAPTGNSGSLRQILSWFANRIKAILGTANWWDAPPTTLAATKQHTADASAHHARYTDAEAIAAVWGAAGAGSGLDADFLRGYAPGTGANNVLKLDSAGKAPLVTIPDTLTGKSADKLDGYDANTGTTKNTIPVRDANGKLPGSITGDAATVGGKAASDFLLKAGDNPTGVINFDAVSTGRIVLPVGTDQYAT